MANITFDDIALDIPCGGGSETLDQVLENGNEAFDKTLSLVSSDENAPSRVDIDPYSINQSYDDGQGNGSYFGAVQGGFSYGEYSQDYNYDVSVGSGQVNMSGTDNNTGESSHINVSCLPPAFVDMSDDMKAAWRTALGIENTSLTTIGGNSGDQTVPANGRKNIQITINNIPEGYSFGAYREISIAAGTGDTTGYQQCAIQFFGTAGGGTKANLGIKNFSSNAVTIKVNVTALFYKN